MSAKLTPLVRAFKRKRLTVVVTLCVCLNSFHALLCCAFACNGFSGDEWLHCVCGVMPLPDLSMSDVSMKIADTQTVSEKRVELR